MEHAFTLNVNHKLFKNPVLVCRWRLHDGELPLINRHLRALVARSRMVTPELVAWIKEHITDTLKKGSQENPDGVLMLLLDESGAAVMTVGPFSPLYERSPEDLFFASSSSLSRERTLRCSSRGVSK